MEAEAAKAAQPFICMHLIVEYLREQLKDNTDVFGEIEIISERSYCDNCKALVDMFEKEFSNIKVTRVEVIK